jgi:hypothetical protein
MQRKFFIVLMTVLIVTTARAQQLACTDPDTQPDRCTIGEAYEFYRNAALKKLGIAVIQKETNAEVTNSNRMTTPPDAFASRIHNSYQDFLNLFSFAINKVDESTNGQALTVRFNPIRQGSQLFGLTLTAAKPEISDVVKNALPETGRADLLAKLQDKLADPDDLTLAGSYSLQTKECTASRPSGDRCYGRSASSYRGILSVAVEPIFRAAPDPSAPQAFALKRQIALNFPEVIAANPNQDIFAVKFSNQLRNQVQSLGEIAAQQTLASKTFFSKQHLDVVASMVDNQPQFTWTGSYRTPGRFGGAKQWAFSAELQVGPDNVNALREECPTPTDTCLQNALAKRLAEGVSTDKWVVAATYTRNDAFKLADLGLGAEVPGFTPVNQKSSYELKVKGQGGRKFGAKVGSEAVRGDLSLEGHRVEKDGARTTNRWIATATITLPLGNNVSIPVSVNYANKAEFLVDQDKKFGAHIGLSYRLPMPTSNP